MGDCIGFLADCRARKGQGIVEYGLLLVLVTLVVIAAVAVVGGHTNNTLNASSNVIGTTDH